MSASTNHHPRINRLFSRNGGRERPVSVAVDAPTVLSISSASNGHGSRSQQPTRGPSKHYSPASGEAPVYVDQSEGHGHATDFQSEGPFDPPIIIEPHPTPLNVKPRRSLDRPLSASYPQDHSLGTSPSTTRISDLPSRLSGWFANSFAVSTTDISTLNNAHQTPSPQAISHTQSPKHKTSGLLTAARHGKGGLEKAVRYFLDSDAQHDKSTEPIWLLGTMHPSHDNQYLVSSPGTSSLPSGHRRDSTESYLHSRRSSPPTISRGTYHPNSSLQSLSISFPNNSASSFQRQQQLWPSAFYEHFTSCLWMTYRSHFPPIRDVTLASLDHPTPESLSGAMSSPPRQKWWPIGGEKSWTSDTGWGCMLRTGQSLLGTALFRLHLSRDWRRPSSPSFTEEYATYVKIISWFLDSPACPFGVHRMALAGKDLGKDVGCWFGPSTAAGAIKTLVHAFPEAQLSVSLATDSVVIESDVYAASNGNTSVQSSRKRKWGERPVLVLIGIRLGIDGVNPVYYDGLKAFFTWPQSVGISGGRPSSSYFFVGEQGGSLFYLDPHHTRPAVSFRPPPDCQAADFSTSGEKKHSNAQPLCDPPRHTQRPTEKRAESSSHSSRGSPDRVWAPILPPPTSQSATQHADSTGSTGSFENEILDRTSTHYATNFSFAEIRTFHCEKVRKMPFAALDPSMLLGFLCRDELEWKDLRYRLGELSRTHKPIFAIADEAPVWDSDSDDLESVSEPDPDIGTSLDSMSDDFLDAEGTGHSDAASGDVHPMGPTLATETPGRYPVEDEPSDWVEGPSTSSLSSSPSQSLVFSSAASDFSLPPVSNVP